MPLLSGPVASVLLAALIAAPAAVPNRALRNAVTPVPPAGEVRTRVDAYLDSKDAPIRPEQWRALGPEGAKVLEEIAQDAKKLPTRRARAVAALAVIGSPGAPKLMIDLAQNESERSVVRMSALRAAGQVLDGAGLMNAVKPILEGAKDAHVRATAASVLVAKNPQGACGVVRTQTARERVDMRPAFEKALKSCAGKP